MARIFLSYAREDRAIAQRLARIAESVGHQVWWDRHLDSGEEFAAEIEAELDRADVVLVAWSATSVKSRWVRDEAAVGGDTDRLVPVSIDGTLPPMGFRQFHTLDLTGWKGAKRDPRTAELLHSLDRRLTATPAVPPAAPKPTQRQPLRSRTRLLGIAAVLAVLIGAAALLMLFGNPLQRSAKPSARTIAIGPFTTTSPDAALRDLASQSRDSVAHAFSDTGVPVKLIDSLVQGGTSVPADYVLSAELSSDAGKYMATVRLEDAAQRATVWTLQVDADRNDTANLPDRVGAQIAGSLAWSGISNFLEPGDPEFTARLLQLDIVRDPLQNYQNAVRFGAQYPKSGIAQLSQAMYTAFALSELPQDQRAQAVAAAREAADRARSIVPHFGDVYLPGCVLYPDVRMRECDDNLRAGLRADADAPFVNSFLSDLLHEVGRTQDALDRASLSYQHDPYMPAKLSRMIWLLETSGDSRDADSLYLQAVRWWPDWGFFHSRISGIIERGDFGALRAVELEPGAAGYGEGHRDSSALVAAVKSRSVPQLERACTGVAESYYGFACMLAFAKLGQMDEAYKIADQIYPARLGRTPAESERMWLQNPGYAPLTFVTSAAAAPMRSDPRFLPLAQRTGLLAYWRSGRPPDFCVQHPEPECGALLKHD